ncbi:hypothetical protein DVK00_02950 [Haloarcula sp. Atlit-47R]|uniref:hypothetical protein n=1 Tax=Haloarcula sp. Atlit-47R TaxID=2282132 RepID=UPI000EF21387|nr:hypothetical protein [Haloarcula sp. Atlit-47R]RLM47482.1 hypothetical protein DVK00_02950 [Haloarcula sp. Atlit-47R]
MIDEPETFAEWLAEYFGGEPSDWETEVEVEDPDAETLSAIRRLKQAHEDRDETRGEFYARHFGGDPADYEGDFDESDMDAEAEQALENLHKNDE